MQEKRVDEMDTINDPSCWHMKSSIFFILAYEEQPSFDVAIDFML